MPELPEVETVVRDLRPMLVGRRFVRVRFGQQKLRRGWPDVPCGCCVDAVERRGKWIIVRLGEARLLIHLGMTGRLTAGPARRQKEPHTHVVITLDDGGQLRFRDERRFGSWDVFAGAAALDEFLDERLGPEPFDLDPAAWRASLKRTARPIKAVLLDQSVVAGVGNIYADEALFLARIHPARRADALRAAHVDRLREAIAEVLRFAIDRRGSSIRNYVGGSGLGGSYQAEFRVYGRLGEPCPACGRPIGRLRLAGRSAHFCPRCQSAPKSF
jgi:formamidopyrimidine-DNA glycosylase